MKAIVQDGFGSADVLELRDMPDPVPGPDEVLLQVRAAGCGPDVWHLMTGQPYFVRIMPGFRKWNAGVRGRDAAGVVESVGANVTDLRPGEEVMGVVEGSFAELAVGAADKLVRKPARLSFEEAAAAPISGHHRRAGAPRRGEARAGPARPRDRRRRRRRARSRSRSRRRTAPAASPPCAAARRRTWSARSVPTT